MAHWAMIALIGIYAYGLFAGLMVGTLSFIALWIPTWLLLMWCIDPPKEYDSFAGRFVQRLISMLAACCCGAIAVFLAAQVVEMPGTVFGYVAALVGFLHQGAIGWIKKFLNQRRNRRNRHI